MINHRDPKRGLAMLELVLALPILLFVMALIVDYGAIAAWKVREHSIARLAVWETRWPRTGASDPRPTYWPATATMENSDQGNVADMDNAQVDVPVARGTLPGVNVNPDLLDPTRGLREGSASIAVNYPLLPKLGPYTINAQTWLIDDKWQYQTPAMGMASNWLRRIPVIYYPLAMAPRTLVSAYTQAAMAVDQAAMSSAIAPLNNDPDFTYYGQLFGWGGPPDFEPQFQQLCSTDRTLTQESVNQLIKRINRLPASMAAAFQGLYQRALAALQGILQQTQPPPTSQMTSLAQSQIPQLQSEIQTLQKFLQTLRGK